MREVYAERLGELVDGSLRYLAGLLDIPPIEAGLQTVGMLPAGMDDEAAARAAASRQVEVVPLSRFSRGGPIAPGLQLGFAAVEVAEIRRGTRELASVLERQRAASRSSSSRFRQIPPP